MKASWLDPRSIVRQLAGHANAAKGESILWLIGVDEKLGAVTGVDRNELANWYPQLIKEFDGVAPGLLADINIDVDGKTIVSLLFETVNAPFVIKVQNTDRLEIPWRQGTRTRSATRAEVLKIFSVVQNQGGLLSINAFIDESPRAQNVAIERPPFWEYILTLELLTPKLRQVRRKYDEVRDGRALRKTRIISGKDFARVVREKLNDLMSWTQVLKSWIDVDLPASWGAPGEPGDPIEIKHAVEKFIVVANELVEWEGELISLRPPEIFQKVQSLMSGLTSRFLEELERFARLLGEPFEHGAPKPGQVVNIHLEIDFPEGKIDEICDELQRVSKLAERDPQRWLDEWNQ